MGGDEVFLENTFKNGFEEGINIKVSLNLSIYNIKEDSYRCREKFLWGQLKNLLIYQLEILKKKEDNSAENDLIKENVF
ncbi:MAG: hypothetical protein JSS34_04945 [Proteobacteria bacterium]|nr:hypothetical protein [Pseudomonadota bacterium]